MVDTTGRLNDPTSMRSVDVRMPSRNMINTHCGRRFRRRVIIAVGAAAVLVSLIIALWRYRDGRQSEERVVAELLRKTSHGTAAYSSNFVWIDVIMKRLRCPQPVAILFLDGGAITDADLRSLERCESLHLVSLDQCDITDQGLRNLSSLQGLRTLHLLGCDQISDSGFDDISKMTSLNELSLCGVKNITGRGIYKLSILGNLTALFLVDCSGVDDDATPALASLKHLLTLDIRGTSISDERVTDLRNALPGTIVISDF